MSIKQIITNEFLFYNQQTTREQVEMWADEFRQFEEFDVAKALKNLRSTKTRMPSASEIIGEILNYPLADDAWTFMPKSEDDHACFNQASSVAFSQVRLMVNSGDHLGAKLAFKAIYDSEVTRLKVLKTKCSHRIDIGFRKDDRADFAARCFNRNLVTRNGVSEFNPDLAINYNQVLIEGPKETFSEEIANENLKTLREIMNGLEQKKKIPEGAESEVR